MRATREVRMPTAVVRATPADARAPHCPAAPGGWTMGVMTKWNIAARSTPRRYRRADLVMSAATTEVRDRILERLVVVPGEPAGIDDRDPGWTGGPDVRRPRRGRARAAGEGRAPARDRRALGRAGAALGERPVRAARRPPGDGRGRQGLGDRARDVGRQPAGRPGRLVQEAVVRGARPQLPLAHLEGAARARADRHLQPLALRGGRGAEGAPRVARAAAAPAR